jgi:hypothetical protein
MTEYLLIAFALIAAAVIWWYKAKHADSLLFRTHTPNAYQPGTLHEGRLITRRVQVNPTALINGGFAPCWEVYGNAELTGRGPQELNNE